MLRVNKKDAVQAPKSGQLLVTQRNYLYGATAEILLEGNSTVQTEGQFLMPHFLHATAGQHGRRPDKYTLLLR